MNRIEGTLLTISADGSLVAMEFSKEFETTEEAINFIKGNCVLNWIMTWEDSENEYDY